jgi:diaminopimelate decarboxylase
VEEQVMIRRARSSVRSFVRNEIGPRLAARRPVRVDLPLERWGLGVGANGFLWSGPVDLERLARTEGTPLHVVLGPALDRNAADALAPFRAGRGADIFYSYKTNPIPSVLERLHRAGVGAEVISPYELWLAFRLQVPPERIIYNGPAKSPASLHEAIRRQIFLINANSAREAELIADVAGDEGVVANLGLRVALRQTWGGQFGITAGSPTLIDRIRAAMSDTRVDLQGLHVHRGSSVRDAATWESYVSAILACCDDVRERTGWHPRVLDIGGSLTCPTVATLPRIEHRFNRAYGTDLIPPDPSACLRIGQASTLAFELVEQHFTAAGLEPPRLVQEPGRSLTGDTQLLLASVVDVKLDSKPPHAVLDAGINIAEPMVNEYHQLFSVSAPTAPAARSYRLAGPICTPADVLYNHWRLPELDVGHVLAIMDSGAYFVPFSTTFSFPTAAVVMQDGGDVTPARRRESFDDMVSHDELGPIG